MNLAELQKKWRCSNEYLEQERQRVRKNVFKKDKHAGGFKDSVTMATWWLEQLQAQGDSCMYCKTPIRLIASLINSERLKGRRTRGTGIRGPYLELERKDSKTNTYAPKNCVLICYYCNNDKSNVYSTEEYIEFLAPAKHRHFLHLMADLALAQNRSA